MAKAYGRIQPSAVTATFKGSVRALGSTDGSEPELDKVDEVSQEIVDMLDNHEDRVQTLEGGSFPVTAKAGSVAFAGGTTGAVVFGTAYGSANYAITLTAVGADGTANVNCWVTAKLATGFTINTSAALTGAVTWYTGNYYNP